MLREEATQKQKQDRNSGSVKDRVNNLQQLKVTKEKAMMRGETYQKQIHELMLRYRVRKG